MTLATSVQGFVQCHHGPHGVLREPGGHGRRRCREDVHGKQCIRLFPIQVRCDTRCPSGQSRAHEEGQLVRSQAQRHSDTWVSDPPGRGTRHQRSRRARQASHVSPSSGVAPTRREEDSGLVRQFLGVVTNQTLEKQIDLMSSREQSCRDVERLALRALSSQARGEDRNAVAGRSSRTAGHAEQDRFIPRDSQSRFRMRPTTRSR